MPQPVLVPRLILTGNKSEVSADCFSVPEAIWVIDEGGDGFSRPDTDSWNTPQSQHRRGLLGQTI
jgi:hypothetical protein